MRHVKLFALCLTVALAGCAIATAVASAEAPVFGFLGETDTFSSKGGALELETTKGEVVKCNKMTAPGPEGGANYTEDFSPTFTGCTATILTKTFKCKSSGAAEEEIKGFLLQANLGWLDETKGEVGVSLSPEEDVEGNPSNLFAEFTCTRSSETINVKVKGSVIGEITPFEKLVGPSEATKDFTVNFKQSKGVSEWRDFEGGAENKLEMETSITEKEGKGFVGSAIEDSIERYPEVATKLTQAWLERDNLGEAGFVGPPGSSHCLFTAVNQKCKLRFKNITNPAKVVRVVTGYTGGLQPAAKYARSGIGCTLNLLIDHAESCTDEIEITRFATPTRNHYCLRVIDPGTDLQQNMCAELVT